MPILSGTTVSAATNPITNDPRALISRVPHGKRGPVSAVTAAASQNRATLPSAPPAATASQVDAPPMPLFSPPP